jgi:hypothetical protein
MCLLPTRNLLGGENVSNRCTTPPDAGPSGHTIPHHKKNGAKHVHGFGETLEA